MVDVRGLRYFIAAAETENLSRAADKLNVVQSALSHQIRNLEQELGADLFIRHGRRLQLSPTGRAFLDDARKIIDDIAAAQQRVARLASGTVGSLRVGFDTVSSRSRPVLESLLAFRENKPNVALDLSWMFARNLTEAVVDGALDAAFVHTTTETPDLDFVELQVVNWVLAMRRDHPLAMRSKINLRDLAGEPFIWRRRTGARDDEDPILAACQRGGLTPNIVQRTSNDVMMVNLASVGLGVALLLETVTSQWPTDLVAFRKVEDFSMPHSQRLIWRRGSPSAPLPFMIDIVRAEISRSNKAFAGAASALGATRLET